MNTFIRIFRSVLALPLTIATIYYLASLSPVLAATDIWTGGGGASPNDNWNNSANWLSGRAPLAADSLVFTNLSTAAETANNDYTAGTEFDGITFGGSAVDRNPLTLYGNGILLSGASNNITTLGITNTTTLAEAVSNSLTLDWGCYTLYSPAGSLNLNSNMTANLGGVADFGSANVKSSSFTNDGTGLIAGLGGAGLFGNTGTGGGFISLATISSGTIVAYTYSGGAIVAAAGHIGATTQTSATNIEITAITASTNGWIGGSSTVYGTAATYINTILLTNNTTTKVQISATNGAASSVGVNGGTLVLGSTNAGTGMYVGGIYLPAAQNGQAVTIGGGNTSWITAGPMTGSAVPGEIILGIGGTNTSNEAELNSVILDNKSGGKVTVVKAGTGSMYFAQTNGYSGGTYVDQGYVQINNGTASTPSGLGTGPVYVASGAEVYLQTSTGVYPNNFYISPGAGTAYSQLGAIKIGNGSTTCTISGPINLLGTPVSGTPGDRIAGSGSSGTIQLTGQISGTGTLEAYAGPGSGDYINFYLGNTGVANNWTGGLLIDAASGNNMYFKITANNQINSNNVTLAQNGATCRFDLNAHSDTIGGLSSDASANDQVGNYTTGTSTLTLGADNASATFGGAIGNSGSSDIFNIIKIGTGTQTFNGANAFYGNLTVLAGTLALSGANGYNGNTLVEGGTLVLSGSGSINSSASITVSNATLNVSTASAFAYANSISLTNGTFNLGNVQAATSSSLSITNSTVNINVPGTNIVTGTLTTGGTTNLIAVSSVPGFDSYPAQITIIKYGSFANVDSGNNLTNLGVSLPVLGNSTGYLTNNMANNSIDLVLTSGPAPVEPIIWNGQTNGVDTGNWDILITSNWVTTAGAPYFYQDTSPVTFDDTLQGTANVNLTTTLSPGSITVNNNNSNYVFSGTGNISGATALTKYGSGELTLAESGGDNFNGGVTVNNGTVVIDNNISGVSGGTTIYSGTVQVGNNDANGNLPSGGVTDNSALVFDRSDNILNVANIISGYGMVANNGSGTVTLKSANTFSGGIVVNAGTLEVASTGGGSTPLGSGSPIINPGGTLIGTGSDAFGYEGGTAPGTINISGGTVTGLGTGNYRITLPNLTFMGGTLTSAVGNSGDANGNYSLFGAGSPTTVTTIATNVTAVISAGTISLQQNNQATGITTFNVAAGNVTGGPTPGVDLLITSKIQNYSTEAGSLDINSSGNGVMALDANNTYSGTTEIDAGVLQLGTANDTIALSEPLGTNAVFNFATLKFASSKGVTVNNVINDYGAGGVLLVSSGTNILTAADIYSGNTLVYGGVLALTGSGSINNSTSIIVSNATLDISASTNTFTNPYSLLVTNGTFNVGTNLVTDLSSLSISNTTLMFPVNTNTPNISVINSSGILTTGGTTNLIIITSLPGMPVYPTNITLIKYSNADPGLTKGNNVLTTLGVKLPAYGNPTGYLTNNIANDSIDLVIISAPPLITPITWNGQTNSVNIGNWDILGTSNWVTAVGAPYFYQDTSPVTFDDTLHGTAIVNLTTTLSPGSITVNNNNSNYVFSGTGNISGTTGLTKTGSDALTMNESGGDNFTGGITMGGGTLTYAATGSFSGGVTNNIGRLILDQPGFCYGSTTNANGATIQVGNNDTNGWLPSGNVANNGSLIFNQNNSVAVNNNISGMGTLTQNGTNNLTLGGASTYTGQTIINSNGTLSISAENNLGANPGSITANQLQITGGTLEITAAATLSNPNRGITLDNALGGTVAVDTGFSATIGNVITGGTLTKTGGGTLILTNGANTFTNMVVSGQTLRDNNVPALGGTATVTVQDGSELYLSAAGLYNNSSINIIGYGVSEGDTANTHLGAVRFAAAGVILSSNVTLIGDAGISSRGTGTTGATISGQISGPYNIRFGRVATSSGTSFGTLILSNVTANANDWTGNTTNMDGTLKMGALNQIPNGTGYGNFIMSTPGAAYAASGYITNTVFDVFGFNQTINGLFSDPNVTGSDLSLLLITNSSGNAATLTVGNSNANGNYAGLIGGNLNLVKIGNGTEILSGTNTYTGATTISNGVLEVDGLLGALPPTTVTVATNATLSGSGSIGGNVTVSSGGTLSPGSAGSIGTLTANVGTISLQGTTLIKINTTSAPATNDVLAANTILYGGALTVTNVGPALVSGDSFTLFSANNGSGSFSVTNLPPLSGGLSWTNSGVTWSVAGSGVAPLSYLKLTSFSLSGGTNLIVNETNAGAGTYYVLASTNVTLPLTSWTAIATNMVSGSGNFTFTATNAVNRVGIKQQFYILSTTNN